MFLVRILWLFYLGTPSIHINYQGLTNSVLDWYPTDSFQLPGPKNDASNSLIWIGDSAHLFYNHWSLADARAYSTVAVGRSLATLEIEKNITIGDDALVTHRWFESVLPVDDGTLYGFYHSEERDLCAFYIKAPEIGLAKSTDQGRTWQNMGIILKVDDYENDCTAFNGFFSNGAGDFSAVYDPDKKFVYILYTNYPMRERKANQGIAAARIATEDLANPVGKVFKWYQGSFSQPGINGKSTSFFKTFRDFTKADPDSFWGPSVHYNTFLKKYVMVLSRTKGGDSTKILWPTEGIYLSTNDDLSNPKGWSTPIKIIHGGSWYPQFIGHNAKAQESTTEMGEWARFFLEGQSDFIVRFKR